MDRLNYVRDNKNNILKFCFDIKKAHIENKPLKSLVHVKNIMVDGIFLTWKLNNRLLGCTGRTHSIRLKESLRDLSSSDDPRFGPIKSLTKVKCIVSIIFDIEAIEYPTTENFKIGRHGLIIDFTEKFDISTSQMYPSMGPKRGVFLPEVAKEQKWTISQTIKNLYDKMGVVDPTRVGQSIFYRFKTYVIEGEYEKLSVETFGYSKNVFKGIVKNYFDKVEYGLYKSIKNNIANKVYSIVTKKNIYLCYLQNKNSLRSNSISSLEKVFRLVTAEYYNYFSQHLRFTWSDGNLVISNEVIDKDESSEMDYITGILFEEGEHQSALDRLDIAQPFYMKNLSNLPLLYVFIKNSAGVYTEIIRFEILDGCKVKDFNKHKKNMKRIDFIYENSQTVDVFVSPESGRNYLFDLVREESFYYNRDFIKESSKIYDYDEEPELIKTLMKWDGDREIVVKMLVFDTGYISRDSVMISLKGNFKLVFIGGANEDYKLNLRDMYMTSKVHIPIVYADGFSIEKKGIYKTKKKKHYPEKLVEVYKNGVKKKSWVLLYDCRGKLIKKIKNLNLE